MKILTGYIAKEATVYSLISLGALTSLLLVGRLLQLTDLIVSKGVEPRQVLNVLVSLLPTFLEISLPISVLLGVMTAFARMSGDSELIVLRANGLNLKQLLPGVVLIASIAFTIHLCISFQLRPWGYRQLSATLFDIAKTKSTSGLNAGLFNHLGQMMIYSEVLEAKNGTMERVLIEDQRDPEIRKLISSKTGRLTSDNINQLIVIELFDGSIHELKDQQYSITKFNNTVLKISADEIFAQDANLKNKRGRELPLASLEPAKERIKSELNNLELKIAKAQEPLSNRAVEENQKMIKNYKRRIQSLTQEFYSRFMLPWSSFIFALLAVPLGVVPARAQKSWGQTVSLVTGLFVFVGYFGTYSIGSAISESGLLPIPLVAALPNIVFILLCYWFIKKISEEYWSSIAGAIKAGVLNIILKLKNKRK